MSPRIKRNQQAARPRHQVASSANMIEVCKQQHQQVAARRPSSRSHLKCLVAALPPLLLLLLAAAAAEANSLPDLTSATEQQPIAAVAGRDVYISCVAKNLQNYTIIWRYTNDANAPAAPEGQQPDGSSELGAILTAGRQRVTSDERISVIQQHDVWLLKIANTKPTDTGTYICHTNSEPRVRVLRILSVLKAANELRPAPGQFDDIDHNFVDCCKSELVKPRCQRLCSFQQLAARYHSIGLVHECYPTLPSITKCMVAGRNVTDCCRRRHIPAQCNYMCGHQSDTSTVSVQDQSYCADFSASIMSCVAEGISTLPGQPEMVIVEATSSTTLDVSWQNVSDSSELAKLDGWIINLTKLSSFEDSIPVNQRQRPTQSQSEPTGVASSQSNVSDSAQLIDARDPSSLLAMSKQLDSAPAGTTVSLRLAKQTNSFTISNLRPFIVYQIQMYAFNAQGRSQLTDPIRALTLAPEEEKSAESQSELQSQSEEPKLPDTRKCCLDRGVTLKRCLDTLCDPVEADKATIADLMICAPWSNVTFNCLASSVDHSNCCKSRGVTPFCLSICSGDIKRVDYRHFRCLTHMSTFTNCILESHDVLPSVPQNFTVGPVTHNWAVLNWRPPKRHAHSLQGYRIYWRRVEQPIGVTALQIASPATNGTANQSGGGGGGGGQSNTTANLLVGNLSSSLLANDEFYYASNEAATNPYLLDALEPSTTYETFVVAVNKFGQSESSVRFLFQTPPEPEPSAAAASSSSSSQLDPLDARLPLHSNLGPNSTQSYYNETACCAMAGVHPQCSSLCSYDIKVADVSLLISSCQHEMPAIVRCMAANRNSVPCCRQRGVADQCLNVCAGLTETTPLLLASRCSRDFGKVIHCMDANSRQIPRAPLDLHTTEVASNRLQLKWSPAPEDALRSDVEYSVRYQQLQPQAKGALSEDPSALIAVVPLHPLAHDLVLSTNKTEATLDKLQANSRYSIYVTAENSNGISLPSLVLVVQTPDESTAADKLPSYQRNATLGAPHSVEVLKTETESIALRWIAPLFISHDANLKYRVFYKLIGSSAANETANRTDPNGSGSGGGASQQLAPSNWSVLETSWTEIVLTKLQYSAQYAITVQSVSKHQLGHMSEILLASTARPVPPTLNDPLIVHNPVEGNNITIMCVALGQPTPQISMFINGLLVQKRTQLYVIYHLVNLTRGHLTISCFASNGHGKDYASVQRRTEIEVKFGAKSSARTKEVHSPAAATARLSCEVTGNPAPTVVWYFRPKQQANDNKAGEWPLGQAKRVALNERVDTSSAIKFDVPFSWIHTLTIRNTTGWDSGSYECSSRNSLAESSAKLTLSVEASSQESQPTAMKQLEQQSDLSECCRSQNVSAKCLPVCSVDGLDVEAAFRTAECQPHLDKLMFCAADGSDHRNCCRARQVPLSCLRWCSGAKMNFPGVCFLSSALDINQCFQEGRALLPGPPRALRALLAADSEHSERAAQEPEVVTMTTSVALHSMGMSMFATSEPRGHVTSDNNPPVISSTEQPPAPDEANADSQPQPPPPAQLSEPLIIQWDPPAKNPALVQYYRVFWRPLGSRQLSRTVTNSTWIRLADLNMNKQYEFVVKAANQHGSSIYSDPLTVRPADVAAGRESGAVGAIWFMPSPGAAHIMSRVLWSICFATGFMFTSFALVMFLERRGYLARYASSKSNSSRVSFANPAYIKDPDAGADGDTIAWEAAGHHSLAVLELPSQSNTKPTINGADTPTK